MSFKQFLQLTLISITVIWSIWFYLLFTIDPVFATFYEFSLFFLTLFLGLLGLLMLIGVFIRHARYPETLLLRQVMVSFRQGFFFAFLVVVLLLLSSRSLFSWWSILPLVAVLTLIEWQAQSHHQRPKIEHQTSSEESL